MAGYPDVLSAQMRNDFERKSKYLQDVRKKLDVGCGRARARNQCTVIMLLKVSFVFGIK